MAETQVLRPNMILSDSTQDIEFSCPECGAALGSFDLKKDCGPKQACSECDWEFHVVAIKAMIVPLAKEEAEEPHCAGCGCGGHCGGDVPPSTDTYGEEDDDDEEPTVDDAFPEETEVPVRTTLATTPARGGFCGDCGHQKDNCKCAELFPEDDEEDEDDEEEDFCPECGWHLDDCVCDIDDEEDDDDE